MSSWQELAENANLPELVSLREGEILHGIESKVWLQSTLIGIDVAESVADATRLHDLMDVIIVVPEWYQL